MKWMLYAVVFIALVIGVTFLIGYALPARTTISRSINLQQTPEAVFAVLADVRRMAEWNRNTETRSKIAASYFVNENAVAEGQLLIAVSNQPLVADSPFWSAVEGAIRFRHKRLFALSLVGVEAKYVRLTFQIEASDGNTRNDFPSITFGAKIRGHLTPPPCSERSFPRASHPRPTTLRP